MAKYFWALVDFPFLVFFAGIWSTANIPFSALVSFLICLVFACITGIIMSSCTALVQ